MLYVRSIRNSLFSLTTSSTFSTNQKAMCWCIGSRLRHHGAAGGMTVVEHLEKGNPWRRIQVSRELTHRTCYKRCWRKWTFLLSGRRYQKIIIRTFTEERRCSALFLALWEWARLKPCWDAGERDFRREVPLAESRIYGLLLFPSHSGLQARPEFRRRSKSFSV